MTEVTEANEANEKQKTGEIETRNGERATATCRLKRSRNEQICVDGVVVGYGRSKRIKNKGLDFLEQSFLLLVH